MSSHCTVEAMKRSPLKRMRQPSLEKEGNDGDSQKRQKPLSLDEDVENQNRVGMWSNFRAFEQEVKPDTPIVPSVKSRLQRLTEKKELYSDEKENGLVSTTEMTSYWKNELARPAIKKARKVLEDQTSRPCMEPVFSSIREKFEEMNHENLNQGQMGNFFIPEGTPNTKVIQAMLLQKSTASASQVIRIKKEREQELAVLRGKTEGKNPWIEKKTPKSCKRSEESPGEINFPNEQKEMKENAESQMNSIPNNNPTLEFGKTPKYDEILQIIEDQEMELSREEQSNSEIIDELFKEVLDTDHASQQMKQGPETQDQELQKSQTGKQNEEKAKNEADELTLPSINVLSPLAHSIKLDATAPLATVLTSLNNSLMESCCSIYSTFKMETPGQNQNPTGNRPPVMDAMPFYSIDLYRTQRRSARQQERKKKEINKTNTQEAAEGSLATKQVTTKEKIKILNDEIKGLYNIMYQASQALNCCTDKEHGKGSREEAEAERHLLIASEKHVALLTELSRIKGQGNSGSRGEAAQLTNGLESCRGVISISSLRLPLKAEFVCSSLCKKGNPSHYFLLIIKCGPHNIVATPLATADDAQQGDTIIFPTIITLRDIHHKFEIDVEVYSLAQTSNVTTTEKRRSARSKVITPKKLLTSITNYASQNRSPEGKNSCCIIFPFQKTSLQSPGASPHASSLIRSSRFVLVGSHTITLGSLGKDKFALDKMKLDGKVKQLLGDEFQDKVPFLSPLEGAIYLKLQCHFASTIEHSGFLTIFEDVSGFGAWHRRWFVLSGNTLSYWTYPNEEKCKKPIGCINLADCTTEMIELASREFCSRPKTLELITAQPQSKEDFETLVVQCRNKLCFTKNWLSADTKEEMNMWMEKLNQVLFNLRAWQQTSDLTSKHRI
ncbi:anillin-like isoform X2 [Narcine bancroftii]|uniref:anillin-like isoform X2 n=1 Tax=Narcine bancroftii TaxID=1343680 RepID=UPI00383166F9